MYFAGASVVLGTLLMSVTAFAASGSGGFGGWGMRGNRAPSVFGTVSAVNGTTLTVTDSRTNTTYTVDASNATVTKNGSASSLGNVSVGDTVMVQGTVNGTSVTASSVIDQGALHTSTNPTNGTSNTSHELGGAVGGFIQHLFGFF